MRKSAKKVISGLLAGLMVLSAAPFSAMAADYAISEVVAREDLPAGGSISPKLDVVWTAYTGNNKAFYLNEDSNWVADGQTITDLSTVSVEGQTVGGDDCTLKANSKGEYFVAASFILKDYGDQFGNIQMKFNFDTSILTAGRRMNATTGWNGTPALLAMADNAFMDENWEYYMTDNGSALESDNMYICYGTRLVNDEVPDAVYVGPTSALCDPNEPDPETAVVIDGLYIATVGFKIKAGTVISDDLLTFERNEFTKYSSVAFGNEGDMDYTYVLGGQLDNGNTAIGEFEVPMKADVPPTPTDHTVTFDVNGTKTTATVADGAALTADQIPALPEKAPDADGHYSYAWDGDTSAVITADTTFTAVETATAHTEKTVDSNVVDADCGNAGSKTVTTYCEVCDYVIKVENNVEIPATGNHTAGEAVKEDIIDATCGQDGSHNDVVYCTVCGEKLSSTPAVDKATGNHTAGEPVRENEVPAQVGVAGSYDEVVYCTVCNEELSRENKEIPALAPDTFTVTYVGLDGNVIATEVVTSGDAPANVPALPTKDADAAGHYTVAWDKDTAAAVTENTTITAVATVTAHTEKTEDSNVVDADCGNAGSKTVTTSCADCGYVIKVEENVEIPATGNHTAGAVVQENYVAPTLEADGSYDDVVYCTVCNQELSREHKTVDALDGVTVTVNATDMGTVTLDDKDATDGASKKYALNGSYTLTATPAAGCTFVGWQVGGKVVSTAATYTPVAVADVTYTPVFVDSTKDITVIYMGLFNNVIATQTVKDAAELQAPTAPTYTGYTFTGWSADLSTITESTTVYAQYDKDAAAAYTVTADGATITSADASGEGTLADVPYGAQVTVTKEGVKAWTIDGAVVAYGDTYSFAVASDVTLVAVEDAVDTAPVVAAVATNRVAGSAKVEFLATRDVPAGYEFVNAGWVYGKNLAADELALANVGKTGAAADAGQVKATYVASTEANAQFILSYGIAAQQGTASAKAFLTVKNTATGEIQTVYSDAMVYTY